MSLLFPPSRPACPALRVACRPVRVSLTLARWCAIPRGLCVPQARSGCPSGSPRVPFACVCDRAPAASAPPTPLGGVACAGRAVSRGQCPSACPAPVPCSVWRAWGGDGRVPVPAYLAWGCATPVGRVCGVRVPEGTTRVSRVRSVRARGPSTRPTACALASRCCSLWGWRKGIPGWGAFHHCEGRLVSGAVPPPASRPLERAARVPGPVCPGCSRCRRGDPAPAAQRALLRAGVTRCGGGGRASPGGVPFHHCEGRLRSGAVPPPTARPLGGLLGSAAQVLWARVCGCRGRKLSPWPACPVGTPCRGGGGGPSLGGMACHRCEGHLVSGAVPEAVPRTPWLR